MAGEPIERLVVRVRDALASCGELELRPPATEEAVAGFERRVGVRLPLPFRAFVLGVADGIWVDDEPWLYGLDDVALEVGNGLGDPGRAFSYGEAEASAMLLAIAGLSDGVGVLDDSRVAGLQKSGDLDGCLTIANHGGNDFSVLVVTGEQAGWVWRTGEIDVPETRELYSGGPGATPLDFLGWLEVWAEEFG
ncbi:SMI1/KNR4 family protein [Dactylosporangium sp. NPDC000244]|uniref:SMI1/KNR4 family protein n=1 Tax=Dactylosporangium sp. NPDC000244 TaxID=3154365 RepID=UPI003325A18A